MAPGKAKGVELEVTAQPLTNLALNATAGYYKYESSVDQGQAGYVDPSVREQPEFSYNLGAQYTFNFSGGSALIPRLDMFYQGYRTNGNVEFPQLKPYNVIPGNTLLNARVTFAAADGKWTTSLSVENLLNDFYWITLGPERNNDAGQTFVYNRSGVPSRPREFSLTFRRKFDWGCLGDAGRGPHGFTPFFQAAASRPIPSPGRCLVPVAMTMGHLHSGARHP